MAKKKKTRQQKIIADLRRHSLESLSQKVPIIKADAPQVAVKETTLKTEIVKTENKDNNVSYSYLIHDLKKTAFLTTSIIALQIVLYFTLTHKILVLPGLSY
jgi:hypothetical protein